MTRHDGAVPKEVLGLLAVLALGVSACSSPTVRGSGRAAEPATGMVPRTSVGELSLVAGGAPGPDDPDAVDALGEPGDGGDADEADDAGDAGAAAGDGSGAAATTRSTARSGPPPTTTRSTRRPGPAVAPSAPATPASGAAAELDDAGLQGPPEAVDDEPSFEAEPLVPLDIGSAAAAPDDAGQGSAPSWARFDRALAAALTRSGNTAASVAVSIGGDVVHAAGFGSRIPGALDPVEVQDRFRVASISKVITAVTLLQLVEDGAIGLDEPIGDRVATHLGLTDASAGSARLTVRQLLTHTSGYGKYSSVFFRNGSADCRQAAAIGLRDGGGGGGYTYSNMNFCIAGMLVEALTGKSYEAVAYERFLTPLGLSGMRLAPTVDPGPDEVQHVTTPGRNYMETLGAAGAWIASPTDLVTIMNALDPTTPGWKPLEDVTLLEMLTPVYGQFGQRGYGMGMILYGGGRYGHTGTIENTHAMLLNRGDGVIWAVTVAGPYPSATPQLESIVNGAFAAGGFVAG